LFFLSVPRGRRPPATTRPTTTPAAAPTWS